MSQWVVDLYMSPEHICSITENDLNDLQFMWHYFHSVIILMVADGLAPDRRQAISIHHDDTDHSMLTQEHTNILWFF